MFTTLVTVTLFAAAAINGAAAQLNIQTPSMTTVLLKVFTAYCLDSLPFVQCEPVDITWSSTTGPYNLIMVSPDDPCGDALYGKNHSIRNSFPKKSSFFLLSVDLGDQDGTSVSWTPNVAPGTQLELSLVDANDDEAWSGTVWTFNDLYRVPLELMNVIYFQITVAQGSDTSCVPADALAAASSSSVAAASSSVSSSSADASSAVSSISASVAVTGTTLVVTGAATASASSASASSSSGPVGAVGENGPLEASSNSAMTLATTPIMVLSAVAGILVLSL
ncbi:hypothetical protein HHX47_DHR7000304 [Lentinula edodes]|nr:hypothetical protein HHX47_DHR7000304 [Lentinula edodes]